MQSQGLNFRYFLIISTLFCTLLTAASTNEHRNQLDQFCDNTHYQPTSCMPNPVITITSFNISDKIIKGKDVQVSFSARILEPIDDVNLHARLNFTFKFAKNIPYANNISICELDTSFCHLPKSDDFQVPQLTAKVPTNIPPTKVIVTASLYRGSGEMLGCFITPCLTIVSPPSFFDAVSDSP